MDHTQDHSNFVISFSSNPRQDFFIFARGYFNAAAILSETLISSTNFADYNAYPIVFLFRHSFELNIKGILYSIAFHINPDTLLIPKKAALNQHLLMPLANACVAILQLVFPNESKLHCVMLQITEIAKYFGEIDPDSFSYRYPINKHGVATTKANQIINLSSLYQMMNKIQNEFEVISFGLNIENKKRQEILEIIYSVQEYLDPPE